MLVLLPPSEGKAPGGDGPPLDLTSLSFPTLTSTRKALVRDVVRLAKHKKRAFSAALGLGAGQQQELVRNAELLTAGTLPALELYTGIVYDNLSYATLSRAARHRADESLIVASALFGLLRPQDRVPPYRLSGGTVLPGLGGLAHRWRPVLEPLLAEDFVVDLRSGAYANLARVPGACEVRVLRDDLGTRTVVSHDNKWTKGRLARALCEHGAESVADVAEIGRSVCDAVEVEDHRVDLLLHGLASSRAR
ncbi:MAG: peroxide stress protein YaaA [Actinomycetota bacterium]|nr:peroxide stress protein YaaA [Actinomycetota bacterium]